MIKLKTIAVLTVMAGTISAQNVGINTDGSLPGMMLDIKVPSGDDGIRINNNSGTGDAMINLQDGGTSVWTFGLDASNANRFILSNGGVLSTTNFISVQTTGEVGIGVNNPPRKLSVEGQGIYADDIFLRDGSVNSGNYLVRIYDTTVNGAMDLYQSNSVDIHIDAAGESYYNPNGADNRTFMIGHSAAFYPTLDNLEVNAGATDNYAINGYSQGTGVAVYAEETSSGLAANHVGRDLVTYILRNSNNNTNGEGALYVEGTASGTQWSSLSMRWGGTWYKVGGAGSVSTVVPDGSGNERFMYCPEAPEVLFQDYGTAQLVNGEVYIQLDPVFAKNIYVDEDHPLKVYVTLEGECKGVYVTEKSQYGFKVKELNGGTSNVAFSYMVVATRIDQVDPQTGEIISKHQGVRFPVAPSAEERRKNLPPPKVKEPFK